MIIKQPEYKMVQRNGQVSFECTIKYDPTLIPTVTWLKDGGELSNDERYVQDNHFHIGFMLGRRFHPQDHS